jgi:type I restriction enzyme, S subunit
LRLVTGDIVVVRSGAYTGDSAIVTPEWAGAVAGFDMVLRVGGTTAPEFLAYALQSKYILEGQINLLRMRAAQPHLNAEELGEIVFFRPPLAEQKTILRHIEHDSAELNELTAAVSRSILLLAERRSALISAAVTGKIDVRSLVEPPTEQAVAA